MPYFLTVDDEEDARTLFAHTQKYFFKDKRPDWVFSTVGSGDEVLAYLDAHPEIDIILTDLMMSPVDGYELIDKIKDKYGNNKLVIVMSAYDDRLSIRRAMNVGAFDFLTKPYDLEDIKKTLDKALAHLQERKELACLLDQALRIVSLTDRRVDRIKRKSAPVNIAEMNGSTRSDSQATERSG